MSLEIRTLDTNALAIIRRRLSLPLLLLTAVAGLAQSSDLDPDQELLFFPSVGYRVDGGRNWELEVRGCVYEPENRWLALGLLQEALKLNHVEMTDAERTRFRERARLFMVDNKRGKEVVVRIHERRIVLEKSRPDGQFSGVFKLSESESRKPGTIVPPSIRQIPFKAVLRANDTRVFSGYVDLVEDDGVTVISDIDDTIKITEVRDRNAMLRHTFLEPFKVVPGMPELYRTWATKSGAQFCYVSASPWQLFLPLSEFLRSNGFPAGRFCLKNFRWKDEQFFNLFQGPEKYKRATIKPILDRFPNRRFVLVGDSGERDPEIYAELARRHPRQIAAIFIREVSSETGKGERCRESFRDLPPGLWKVFRDPAEIAKPIL